MFISMDYFVNGDFLRWEVMGVWGLIEIDIDIDTVCGCWVIFEWVIG